MLDGQNGFVMVEGEEEELQAIRLLLTTNLSEWFLDIEHGLDYSVFQKKQFDELEMREAVLTALSQEKRIEEIVSLDINFDRPNRTLYIYFVAQMVSGNFLEESVPVEV